LILGTGLKLHSKLVSPLIHGLIELSDELYEWVDGFSEELKKSGSRFCLFLVEAVEVGWNPEPLIGLD
jgi:hypothetical protein